MLSLTPTFAAFSNGVVGRSAVAQRSGAMTMGVESLVGASEEISGKVWDPLNLSANMDEGNLNLVRAAELKHCRVAMLATVGWCWTATGTHFEGMLSTSAGISFASLAQLDPLTAASKVPAAGIWQMIVAIGCLEVYWENKFPAYKCGGNYGVPACTQDPAKFRELQLGGAEEWPAGDDRHHLVRDGGGPPGQRAPLPLLERRRRVCTTTKRNACRPCGGRAELRLPVCVRVCMAAGARVGGI